MKNLFFMMIIAFNCSSQEKEITEVKKKAQDSIIDEYLTKGAERYNYIYQMNEWQKCLDEGLAKDSTIAYLWQQKAMPYFKVRKYEIGMMYVDKAVKYDAKIWQPYRAFIKCIFVKTYKDAIIDFEDCIKKYGNQYIMDHTYNFYIGLCYLQLNEFKKAEILFKEYNDDIFKNRQGLEHPTPLFYFGISLYEQQKWQDAIIVFDSVLKIYPNFSDVEFYKAVCLGRLKKNEEVEIWYIKAKDDAKLGYSINEDNVIYEPYPYQNTWK
jgi:tetratricopeptide (TPR) repeat protein